MNQKTKDKILREAENYLHYYTQNDIYKKGLKDEVVSRADLLRLSTIEVIRDENLEDLLEIKSPQIHVEGDLDLVETRAKVIYTVIGEIYDYSPEEVQERLESINKRIAVYYSPFVKN